LASGVAHSWVGWDSWVALLTSINETITALWEEAVGFALVGSVSVGHSFITLLSSVNNTITAVWLLAVSSACTRSRVRVHWSIITFLSGLDDAIVGTAFGELGNVEVELGKEFGFGGTNVVQQGDTNKGSVSEGVEQLSFEVSVSTVDGMLRW